MKKKLKDFVACFSLSSIIVLGPSLTQFANFNFFLNFEYLRLNIVLTILTILSVSCFFYLLKIKTLFSKNKFIKYSTYAVFLISFAFFLRAILKIVVNNMKPFIFIFFTITALVLIVFSIVFFIKKPKMILNFITTFLIILFPFSLFLIYKASVGFFSYKQEKVQVFKNNKPKVIWIIFDEWDQFLSFEKRPNNVELKEFDKLKQKAFSASRAFQPGSNTIVSIPAYTTGKKIVSSQVLGFNNILLNFPDGKASFWHKESNIFSKLHSMEINSAAAGLYPYEKLFNKYCTEKYSYFNKKNLFSYMPFVFYQIIEFYLTAPLTNLTFHKVKFFKSLQSFFESSFCSNQYFGIKENAFKIMKNRDINFCFIHFSIPQPPGIYSKKNKKITKKISSYSENLILMDKTLTEIKLELQKSNIWDESILIFTSDHWLRKEFWDNTLSKLNKEEMDLCSQRKEALVPLIIKMPHQEEAISYDKPFNAISLHNLVLDIYNDKASNRPLV